MNVIEDRDYDIAVSETKISAYKAGLAECEAERDALMTAINQAITAAEVVIGSREPALTSGLKLVVRVLNEALRKIGENNASI
jgi:hypothetical protein